MNGPTTVQQAHRQANCLQRAKEILPELRKGGLYVAHTGSDFGKMDIQKRGFEGEPDVWYTVDLVNTTCDCPDFANFGGMCKHTLACEMYADELASEESCLRMVALMEDAECAAGCDYRL